MQMELISSTAIPDGLLAAMMLLSEKPRLGVPSWNPAPNQGIDERNCTAVLGLRFRWSEIVSGTVVAPNNATIGPYSQGCATKTATDVIKGAIFYDQGYFCPTPRKGLIGDERG
jgi:hypothetical protein